MNMQIVQVRAPQKVTVKINYADIYELATVLLADIRHRTGSGKDAADAPFVPYSLAYLKYKENKMSKIEGAVPGKVTLMDSGKMITKIKIKREGNFAVAYFPLLDRAKIAWYHQTGAGRLPRREWMTVSPRQKRMVLAKLSLLMKV
jgi:hypothetical protein